jgi:hypothetical protein
MAIVVGCVMGDYRESDRALRPAVSPLGRKTDARERCPCRFSQELPVKLLYRMKMSPVKKQLTASMKAAERSAHKLQNIHSDRINAPAIHGYAEIRPLRERHVNTCHGALFTGTPQRIQPIFQAQQSHPELEPPWVAASKQAVKSLHRRRPDSVMVVDQRSYSVVAVPERKANAIPILEVRARFPHLVTEKG